MQISLTLNNVVALFGAMVALAMVPSLSVLTVVTRSATFGLAHGLATVIGIVIGDFILIILAIYGLSAVAENMDNLFTVIKYCGGTYLIYLGIRLIRSKSRFAKVEAVRESSWLTSFWCGLAITLGDQKAIFFYVSFFPAFVDLSQISIIDTIIILAIAAVAVGGVKLGYGYLADRAQFFLQNYRVKQAMDVTAGTALVCTGIFLMAKT